MPKMKVIAVAIKVMTRKIMHNCYISMNDKLTKMILINGDLDEKNYFSLHKSIGENKEEYFMSRKNIMMQSDKGDIN